jgi:H/ACA ribonucleoprotein complex subunit 4
MTASMIRKARTATDSRFGKRPEERSIEEMLSRGVVVIDKPMGPTSHQVAAWVRDMLGAGKAGHGGTLDPRATGVLPVGLGSSVRAMDYIHQAGKKYVGVMRLHGDIDDSTLQSVSKEFVGEIFQTPPVRSAVKRAIRTRKIYSLGILEKIGRDALIDVSCEGGTYIRSLCVDIGDALGVGAHLQDLRRVSAGPFGESQAVALHTLRDAVEFWREGDAKELTRIMLPIESVFSGWKKVLVKDSSVDSLCHGAPLAIPGIVEFSKDIAKNERIAVYTTKEEIIATGKAVMSADEMAVMKDGHAVLLERVFMEPSTYPRNWASKAEVRSVPD